MRLRTRLGAVAAVAAAAVVTGTLVTAAPAQASFQTFHGCGSGVACVYNGEGYNFAITNAVTNGWQNLFNMFGNKYYVNNQTQNWAAGFCTGSGETGTCYYWRNSDFGDPSTFDVNMTPYNSVFVMP